MQPRKSPVDASVVLPTYNEAATVGHVLRQLDEVLHREPFTSEILLVDDNSKDRTVEVTQSVSLRTPLRIIERRNERGLASAILRGFQEAEGRALVVLDTDGSHPPSLAPTLLKIILWGEAEMAIASRYADGGVVSNWRLDRRLLSMGATLLARPLTNGENVQDPMSGFFAIHKKLLTRTAIKPIGYKLGFEMIVRCGPHPIVEVPYVFQDRVAGKSKLSLRQVGDFIWHVGSLYRYAYRRRFSARPA